MKGGKRKDVDKRTIECKRNTKNVKVYLVHVTFLL